MFKFEKLFILALVIFFVISPILYAQVIKDDFRVNDDVVGGNNSLPDVQILKSGEEIIVWRDDRNGEANIYGQLYDSTGNSTGTNFKVSTYTGATFENQPAISFYGDSLLVIWSYGFGQWLLSDGSQSGSSFYLGSGNVISPDMAVSDSGFFVVWHDYVSGQGYEVFIKRFAFNGDSIGPRIVIDDDPGIENQTLPSISADNDGNMIVVWGDNRNGSSYGDIYGQLFDPSGNKVGSNFRINDDSIRNSNQYWPSCAMDWAGNFVVTWIDNRNANEDIYGQRFDTSGSPVDTNFRINDDAGNSTQYEPSCATDSAGNFVVVWCDYRTGHESIYGQIFDSTGSAVGSNFWISQNAGSEDDFSPEISMNKDNFIVTWYRYISAYGDRSIWKRRYENDGTPVTDAFKVNNTEGTANQYTPEIDMNPAGYAVVTWEDDRVPQGIYYQRLDALGNTLGGNIHINAGYMPDVAVSDDSSSVITYYYGNDIYYQRIRSAGDTVGSPLVVSDVTSGSRGASTIDIGPGNSSVVTWEDYRNGNYDIYAQMIDGTGTPVGANLKVNDDPGSSDQLMPTIAMSPSGRFLVAWYDYRDGNSDIYGQIYDSDGSLDGSNFRIDSGGTEYQYYPDAKYLSDGNFIVVWEDCRLPSGVYAQIIDTTGVLVDTNFRVDDESHIGSAPSVSITPLGEFVVAWRDYYSEENDIYARKYNSDHSPDSINFKVNNETEGANPDQGTPCVATNGNSIIFAWQDAKWQKGYDIAAKVLGWTAGVKDVTYEGKGVKILGLSSPILSGKEWLTISVGSPAKVEFQIINVAGIVVSSQELTYTTPGIKKVEVDVSKLPSGPYFLSLETQGGKAVKKTVVIR
jgi:hypothetical protein